MAERKPFTVRLSPEAREALQAFCVEHGITMTGYFEACAQMLGENSYAEQKMDLVVRARQIDGTNRFR